MPSRRPSLNHTKAMTDSALDAQSVADFLQSHPEFFAEHPEVFSSLRVPNPHGQHAISLPERQIQTLRERVRTLELQLSSLIHNARNYQGISETISGWNHTLLAQVEAIQLPTAITKGLEDAFDIQSVALRVWDLQGLPDSPYSAPVSDDIRTFVDSLVLPYCGRNTEFEAVAWLAEKPASLALIPLRLPAGSGSIGLLVLGSQDADRFGPDHGVDFLQNIGALAQAALLRLHQPATPVVPELAG